MESKRTRIIGRVKARFEGIKKAQGFKTDLGLNVFVWRTGTFSEEELEGMPDGALVIRDIDEIKTVEGDQTKVNKLSTEKFMRELHIQCEIVTSGTDAAEKFRKAVADIETAIRKDVRWKDAEGKPLAIGTRPRIDRSVVEQQSRKVGGDIYEFFIHYVTGAFNAYE